MSKQYGLIIPGQQKEIPSVPPVGREISKPSVFDESSSDDDSSRPQLKSSHSVLQGPSLMERRVARNMQEKALKEDPTIFQYDELYDEMEQQREQQQQVKSKEPKKPKYIGRLMECAERRKLENELRIERQVQKEREEEGEQFKDKESFVTATYRKKLEEMRKLQEEEQRDEYLEAIGDVTKQKDLDGFYRHLYEQKLGTAKAVLKPGMPQTSAGDEEEIAYKPIKSGKPQQRAYRKRHASDEEEEEKEATALASTIETKKVHLQNNIDADSDFSIDSSSEEEGSDAEQQKSIRKDTNESNTKKKEDESTKTNTAAIALNLDALKKEKFDTDMKETTEDKSDAVEAEGMVVSKEPEIPAKSKRDKSEIWKKRTVGKAFDAAVQRYFQRKAARSA